MIAGIDREDNIEIYLDSSAKSKTDREMYRLRQTSKLVGPIIKPSVPRVDFIELILQNDKPSQGIITEYSLENSAGIYRTYLSDYYYYDLLKNGVADILIDAVEKGDKLFRYTDSSRLRHVMVYDSERMSINRKMHKHFLLLCNKEICDNGYGNKSRKLLIN